MRVIKLENEEGDAAADGGDVGEEDADDICDSFDGDTAPQPRSGESDPASRPIRAINRHGLSYLPQRLR